MRRVPKSAIDATAAARRRNQEQQRAGRTWPHYRKIAKERRKGSLRVRGSLEWASTNGLLAVLSFFVRVFASSLLRLCASSVPLVVVVAAAACASRQRGRERQRRAEVEQTDSAQVLEEHR